MRKLLLSLAVALAITASGGALQPVAAKKPCGMAAACQQCKAADARKCGAEAKCVETGAPCVSSTDGKRTCGADCQRGRCGASKGPECNSPDNGKCYDCKAKGGT